MTIVLIGAGISAGLSTFRGTDGLREGHRVVAVATANLPLETARPPCPRVWGGLHRQCYTGLAFAADPDPFIAGVVI